MKKNLIFYQKKYLFFGCLDDFFFCVRQTMIFGRSWNKWNKTRRIRKEAKREEIDGRQCILTRRWRDSCLLFCPFAQCIVTGCFEHLSAFDLLLSQSTINANEIQWKPKGKWKTADHLMPVLAWQATEMKRWNLILWQATIVLIFKYLFSSIYSREKVTI